MATVAVLALLEVKKSVKPNAAALFIEALVVLASLTSNTIELILVPYCCFSLDSVGAIFLQPGHQLA